MPPAAGALKVTGFSKRKMAEVTARAKRLGMTPERYLRHLIDEDLAISREARSKSFEELMGPGREVDERELDRLVERARTRHFRSVSQKTKG